MTFLFRLNRISQMRSSGQHSVQCLTAIHVLSSCSSKFREPDRH